MLRTKNVENEKILGLSKVTHVSKFESQEQSIQKEVDNYTRKFQEEKRKLFRAQENNREILKEYQNQVSDLENMKTRKYKTETAKLTAQLKGLEGDLEKSISAYNEALAKNNSLKNQIDELRKDKKNQMEAYKKLTSKIEEIASSIKQKQSDINLKKQKLGKNKEEILEIKQKNEKQHLNFKKNIEQLGKNIKISESNKDTGKAMMKTAETSDSQPLVKNRLRNILFRNKEKIKICDSYKKNMEKIQQNFQEIRQRSGIQQLEEIKNIFLKQDQQNIFISQYISKLNGELDSIKEENDILTKKIQEQEEKNLSYRSALLGTPEEKRRRIQIEQYMSQKQKPIQKMNQFLSQVSDMVLQTLNKDKKTEGEINYLTYEQNLAQLQKLVDEQFNKEPEKVEQISEQVKQDVTKYSRGIPTINFQQVRDRNEEGLLYQGRFRDYASDFWDKKKQTRN